MENAVPVQPAIPSNTASENPIPRPSIKGIPLTIAQVSQNRATEHIAVERRVPRSLRGMVFKIIPRTTKATGTDAMGMNISHSE